jgi:hypothetical protein
MILTLINCKERLEAMDIYLENGENDKPTNKLLEKLTIYAWSYAVAEDMLSVEVPADIEFTPNMSEFGELVTNDNYQ